MIQTLTAMFLVSLVLAAAAAAIALAHVDRQLRGLHIPVTGVF